MRYELTLDAFILRLKSKQLTDKRTGQNVQYEVNDAAQAAFAIFFMQSGCFWQGNATCNKPEAKVMEEPSSRWSESRQTPTSAIC